MQTLQCVVVMPTYNEEGCIQAVLSDWLTELTKVFGDAFRLVIVNDGSTDQTGHILKELAQMEKRLLILHQSNAGHGAALLNGYRTASELSSAYIFHVDSDAQFLSSDFQKLWEKRTQSAFILGYRKERYDALLRLLITRILRCLLFLVFGVWIPDSNVPYRLIKTSYLTALLNVLPSTLFAPNIFLAILAAKDDQPLMSIPITHRERKSGHVSIIRWKLIKVCFRTAGELIVFRFTLKHRLRHLDLFTAEGAVYSA